ncbi:unnamed protein product [Allacma fusca]|uniref:Uncharacterized protein n=1 Tax=Allacma fusca TaxID=39272 RepID=A0A8J2PWJ7_9HEXA|nr:unnamed protein product [Allacma fusca]
MHKLSSCIIDIYEFAPIVDYSHLQNPILLTNPEFLTADTPRKLYNSLIRSSYSCISEIVLLPSNNNIQRDNFTTYSGKKLSLMYQQFSKRLRPLVYTESFYALQIQSSKEFRANPGNGLQFLDDLFNINPSNVPPVFFLLFGRSSSSKIENSTMFWFSCKYCASSLTPVDTGRSFNIFEFACSSMGSCYDEMIKAYLQVIDNGRNVAFMPSYNDLNPDHIIFTVKDKRPSPFNRELPVNKLDAVDLFLIEGLNSSMYQDYLNLYQFYPCPVTFRRLRAYDSFEMFHFGTTERFNFITPDRVTNIKTSFASFWKPFKNKVWILLATSTLIIALLTIYYGESCNRTNWILGTVTRRFLLIWFVMLDQKVSFPKMQQVLFGIYIIMAVLITLYYKAFLKSDYTVEIPFKTEWKYIKELRNFSFYLLLNDSKCPSQEIKIIPNITLCEELKSQNSDPCYFFSEMQTRQYILNRGIVHYHLQTQYELRIIKRFKKLQASTFLVCLSNVKHVLKEKSTRIAFITTESDFEFCWLTLQQELKTSGLNLQFGSNRNVKDNFLVSPFNYFMTSGLGDYNQMIPNRMRTLFTSGIYDLWANWDVIRFTGHQRQFQADDTKPWRPLGLFTSNIRLIFQVLGFASCGSFLIVGVESLIFKYSLFSL